MKQVEDQYPMLLVPRELISIIEDNDNILMENIIRIQIGDPPDKPTKPKPIDEPHAPNLSSHNHERVKFSHKVLIGVLAFGFLIFALSGFDEGNAFLVFLVTGIPFLFALTKFLSDYFAYSKEIKDYNKKNRKYQVDIQSHNKLLTKYKLNLADYEIKMELYNDHLREYESWKEELLENTEFKTAINKNREEGINRMIAGFSQNIIKPQKSEKNFQVGISENYFLKYLNKYFKDIAILKHYTLEYFEPDFTLILENGLHIDIEIDEPYTGNTKEVIHYYDKLKRQFSDYDRNKFFIGCGWIVIRFSEQQIIEQPDACCKYLAKTLQYFNHNSNIENFKGINDILPMQIWSIKEANEMAYFDYRKKYLNEDFLKKTINKYD